MTARLSPRNEEPVATSPSERSIRKRSSNKGWPSSSSTSRRSSQLSPTSEVPTQSWQDDRLEEDEDGLGRSSLSSHPSRTKERKASIPLSPPTLEEDSFYEEDDPQKPENVLGNWHFAPLLIAILPPLGAVIGGQADAWSDAILLLLASFWLYQFLKVPHDIYHAARTRRILQADVDDQDDQEAGNDSAGNVAQRRQERAVAAAELRRAEMISLIALILSPLAGAWLLTWLMEVFTDGNRYLNKFNIRLFMLASGIRPWSHAIMLFRQRLLHLQEVVHYPSSRVEALNKRLTRMDSDLSTLRKLVATKSDVTLLREGIDMPLTQLSRSMRRYEKKEEHLRMSAEDKFSLVESRLEDLLREVAINAELIEEERRERQRAASLPASIFQALRYALGQRGQDQHSMYEGQRTLTSNASLGITAHPNDATPGSGKVVNGMLPSAPSSEGPPGYSSPPRYGPAPPQSNSNPLTVSSAPSQSSPGWTEAGLAYWVFLPVTIPRSVIRGALSFAGSRVNAARDVNYTQSYAAAMSANPSEQNSNGPVNSVPQHHRLTGNTNGKIRPTFPDRLDTRTTASPAGNLGSSAHFSRRV